MDSRQVHYTIQREGNTMKNRKLRRTVIGAFILLVTAGVGLYFWGGTAIQLWGLQMARSYYADFPIPQNQGAVDAAYAAVQATALGNFALAHKLSYVCMGVALSGTAVVSGITFGYIAWCWIKYVARRIQRWVDSISIA